MPATADPDVSGLLADEGPEVRSLESGLRASAEAALGVDLGGVSVVIGGGVAEGRAAAATTVGSVVYVHPDVVEEDEVPEEIVAHELTHVAQGMNGGGDGDPEDEAADNVDAVLSGTPSGAAAVAAGPHDLGLVDWMTLTGVKEAVLSTPTSSTPSRTGWDEPAAPPAAPKGPQGQTTLAPVEGGPRGYGVTHQVTQGDDQASGTAAVVGERGYMGFGGVVAGQTTSGGTTFSGTGQATARTNGASLGGSQSVQHAGDVFGGGGKLDHAVAGDIDVVPIADEPGMSYLNATLSVSGGVGGDGTAKGERKDVDGSEPDVDGGAPVVDEATPPPAPSAAQTYGIEGGIGVALAASGKVTLHKRLPTSEAEIIGALLKVPGGLVVGLRRLGGVGRAVEEAGDLVALASPEAAKGLSDGDAVEFELGGSASVSGRVGATQGGPDADLGISASGSASAEEKRTVCVRRTKDREGKPIVEVTIRFESGRSATMAGEGRAAGASLSRSSTSGSADRQEVIVQLDPETSGYSAQFTDLTLATNAATARDLARRFGDAAQHSRSDSQTLAETTSAGFAGFGGEIGRNRDRTDASGRDAEGWFSSMSGSAGESLSASYLGVGLWAWSDTQQAEVTSREGAGEVRASDTESQSSLDGFGLDALWGWVSGEDGRPRAMRDQETVQELALTDNDLALLAQRYRTAPEVWGAIGVEALILDHVAWDVVGAQLTSSQPDAETLQDGLPEEMAVRATHYRAIVDFVAAHGADARDALTAATSYWGAYLRKYRPDLMSEADPVGERSEWPPDLKAARGKLVSIESDLEARRARAQPPADNPQDRAMAQAQVEPMLTGLDEVQKAVIDHVADFETAGYAGALERIQAVRDDLRAWRLTLGADGGEGPAEVRMTEADEAEIGDLEAFLRAQKAFERVMFAKIEAVAPRKVAKDWFIGGRANAEVYLRRTSELDVLYSQHWIPAIRRLREVYLRAGVGRASWAVSARRGEWRSLETEPDLWGYSDLADPKEKSTKYMTDQLESY